LNQLYLQTVLGDIKGTRLFLMRLVKMLFLPWVIFIFSISGVKAQTSSKPIVAYNNFYLQQTGLLKFQKYFLAQPNPYNITPGGSSCGSVQIGLSGSDNTIEYQLQRDGSDVGSPITSDGVTPIDFGVQTIPGTYTVVATDPSDNSTLTMSGTVVIFATPANPTITPSNVTTFCQGGSVTLTSSPATSYQWFESGNPIGGATGQSFIANASGSYTVEITDANGCTATSAATAVTVNPLPAAPTISAGGPVTFCAGGSVTLSSTAATSYQWFESGNPIGGATSQSFIANASGNYTVEITDANGCTAVSAATAVTVNPLPAAPTISAGGPVTFCIGGSVTLSSTAATSYQWFESGNPIAGATSQSFIANASGNYTVEITDANGCTAVSTATAVTVNPLPAAPTISAGGPVTFCIGGSVTLSSTAATSYQWFESGNPIAGATSQSFIANASGNYTVEITDANGCTALSAATAVTVNPLPAAPTISAGGPVTFCIGGSVTLSSTAATSYQWFESGNPIAGATSQSFIANASGNYTVEITDANGCTALSAATAVTVNPLPAAPTISAGGPVTFCAGGSVTLSSTAATSYQWFESGNPIGGATGQSFIANASGNYTVEITDANGCTALSAATAVTVNPLPAAPTISAGGPVTFCAGGSVTLSSTAATSYQWFESGNPIAGETSQSFIANASGNYTVEITDANGCTAVSAATAVTVNPIPAAPTATNNGPICNGSALNLAASVVAGATYSWTGPNSFTSSVQNPSIPAATVAASGIYSVTVSVNGCTSTAGTTTATVNGIPATPAPTNNGPVCEGSALNLTNAAVAGATYSWTGPNSFTSSAQNPSIPAATTAASGIYSVTVTVSGCTSAAGTTSASIIATPTTSNAGADQTLCATTGTLAANTPTVGTGTWTLVSGVGTITTPTSPTSGVTALGVGPNVFRWTISNNPCTASFDEVTISRSATPTVANAGADQTGAATCGLTSVTLAGNAPAAGTGTWSIVSGAGGTITTPSSPTSNFSGTAGTTYVLRWTISNAPCAVSQDDVTITFNRNPTTSNAGADQSVCATTATLAGNAAAIGTGTWTLVSGAGTITTPTSPTSGVTALGVGANVFRWTISNNPCTASFDEVTITRSATPTVANAGPDQTGLATCGLTTVTLAANTPATGTGAWSIISGAGGTITTPSSPTSTFSGVAGTTYTLRWIISNAPCAVSQDDVIITFNRIPTASNAGPDQTGAATCGLTSVTLAGNAPAVGTGAWSIVSGAGGTITTPSSPTSNFSGTAGTTYTLRWTISNAPCTASTDDINCHL
jgi:hypothetical protein